MPITPEVSATLAVLQSRYADGERKQNALWSVIESLYAEAGESPPPRPAPGGSAGGGGGGNVQATGTLTSIKDDTFYGKKLQTAVREYLEMRKAQAIGPATPRQIYESLVQGGYKFEAKDQTTALIGLRGLLRKRSHVFHKLPNGAYGMTAWYPHAKTAKAAAEVHDDDSDAETATATPKKEAAAA
jgi:hypothetical protein